MILPGFDILDKISEDRLTVVWKANQTSLNRAVALKILRQQPASNPQEVQDFLAEGRTIAKLKHPGILQVYDVIQIDRTCFFVMECVTGPTLADRLAKEGRIGARSALSLAFKLADALGHAWKTSHLIHRNIKPENIHIDQDGNAKIAFIGLAKVVSPLQKSTPDEDQIVVGTPYYMSPEQAQCSAHIDCRSDMYGLGALMYHMLVGHAPFHELEPLAAAEHQISGHLPHPRDLDATIQQNVSSLLVRLMMKDPKDRHSNWEEVTQHIQKLLAGQPLLRKPDLTALSTIEPEAREISVTTSAARDAAATPVPSSPGAPLWIHIPAWTLIIFWWYQLTGLMLTYWAR